MNFLREMITEGLAHKASVQRQGGKWYHGYYPKGSYGYELGVLCFAFAGFYEALSVAFTKRSSKMQLVNAYTVSPTALKEDDVMLFVVKAMVTYRGQDGKLRYRLYRCRWKGDVDDIPQGDAILEQAEVCCQAFFPSLALVGQPE